MKRWRIAPLLLLAAACSREADLVVYVAHDQVYSEPIVQAFERETGLKVEARYDTEATKTVGLANALIAEAGRPRADLFWNNEIAQTIRLKNLGLTQPHVSETVEGMPAEFRDPDGHWTGFGARARIIMYREDMFGPGEGPPTTVDAMLEPVHAKGGAMARPLTGTTLTHFSALSSIHGPDAALDWLQRAKESELSFGRGNAHVMRRVRDRDLDWCLTDTDDAAAARLSGHPVSILYPDQGEGEAGTLLIPNTICVLKGAPNLDTARVFADWLLSGKVEEMLAECGSDQIPLRPGLSAPDHVKLPGKDFRVMKVDWEAVGAMVEVQLPLFQELFTE